MVCIIFCCIGSMPDIGVSFCVDHMIAMLSTGRMQYGSRAVRSWIHSVHGAWRSSTDSISTQYRALKMIICGSTGRQPPTALSLPFLLRSLDRPGAVLGTGCTRRLHLGGPG